MNRAVIAMTATLMAFSSVASTQYPITINNCGQENTFKQAPRHVVTIGQHETELMLALGLRDRISATSVWFGALPESLNSHSTPLKRLADNAPSFESVVNEKPDLVAAQYTYHVGPKGEVGTRDQFEELGIHTWVSPSDCQGKGVTNNSNSDGARQQPFSVNLLYQEIDSLARIFDVNTKGMTLKQQLKHRIKAAKHLTHRFNTQHAAPKILFWFSSSRLKGDPWVAGNMGAPGWIAKTLGLDNIIHSPQEWPAVSWETITSKNPDYIVIASMERRLYPADDVEKKIAFLKNDPVTSQMKAVKNNHIIVVPAMSLNPSLRNVDAAEAIAKAISSNQ